MNDVPLLEAHEARIDVDGIAAVERLSLVSKGDLLVLAGDPSTWNAAQVKEIQTHTEARLQSVTCASSTWRRFMRLALAAWCTAAVLPAVRIVRVSK